MTLSVHVFTSGPDGAMEFPVDEPHGRTLAGFESWRRTVWGSERVRALGAAYFPRLAHEDLYIEPGLVVELQRECALLRANLQVVAGGLDSENPPAAVTVFPGGQVADPQNPDGGFVAIVSQRLANIESAVAQALLGV
ncbi:hypothetical protein KDL01_34590 [Actinospica durhamensis]|uniref:Uncharacterized protein n=1 Tax=Actinospica durhamensis TaxID=1508375 RepID=A0A941EWV6_9ACTN|nr:hypothetical protein [Actinospica durhamensis]MBR7838446.1 hypothetical protein [Actinospica durhamensis]